MSCDEDKEVIFIGDSLVHQWDVQYFFPGRKVKNYGVNGARVEDILGWKINSSERVCVLLIGTNNLSFSGQEDYFSDDFKTSFIESYINTVISLKATKVIFISLLPRYHSINPEGFNNAIKDLNSGLKDSLMSYDSVFFLNAFDSFNEDGKIKESYYIDGLHLNYYGYELLSSLLTKHL